MPDPSPPLPLAAAAELQGHLLAAGHDLARLQRLLADANATLLQQFHAVDAQLRATRVADADVASLQALLGPAVTALQFQDLAEQLIAHTTQRLRSCADRLAQQAFPDDGEDDGGAVVTPAPGRPNPVTQDEMDAGSIELF